MSTIMYSSHHSQSYSADLEGATPAQDKAMLQRQYRAKEAHALFQLQKLLRDISQGPDVHQTRLQTIVQATEMLKSLYCRNAMLQELHQSPHLEPGHSATAAFNYHLIQHTVADWQWDNVHMNEHSAGAWDSRSPAIPGCPTSPNGDAMSGSRSLQH
ncbi:hypothetical protein BDR04DRAFT_682566 [Suillus decipiens]|nr:hypothetical protein BDR04DRAFT_682566 [Suillus decipiens]